MMTWDNFWRKCEKIAEKTNPDWHKIAKDEFGGEWSNIAFAILEYHLYDVIKYSSLCKDKESRHRMVDAQILAEKLEEFKTEFEKLCKQ